MSFTTFDHLEEFDIAIPPENPIYPWFAVYDFEAILSRLEEEPPTPQLKWLSRHDHISVSVASNMMSFNEPQGFVNTDPKKLIEDMMHYMGEIADQIYEEAKQKWKYVFDKLEEHHQEMVGHELGADDDKDEEKEEDDETIPQTLMTEEEITDKEWHPTHDKLVALQLSFNHYCRQVPVLGFNSAGSKLGQVSPHAMVAE